VRGGTYESLIGDSPAANHILHNPRLKLSLLPASPELAGAEVELVGEIARENYLNNALLAVRERYDYILIDCPPSLGLLTLNGIIAARDGVVIPVQCEYLPLEGLSQLKRTLDRIRNAIFPSLQIRGVLLTMFDGRTNLSNDVENEVRSHFTDLVFATVIPRTVRLAEAPSYGQPISVYAPASNGAEAYTALARELLSGDGVEIPALEV
jgi:chromosome partitioning protein